MPPWRGAQLKHRDNFTFYLHYFSIIIASEPRSHKLMSSIYVSQLKMLYGILVFHVCYMPFPSHPPWFDFHNMGNERFYMDLRWQKY
jgi:hypothetical protein